MKWKPRSGSDMMCGCKWLPRMIDKARRVADNGHNYLIDDEYMFGENDFADSRLLHFLGLSAVHVLEIVRTEPNDVAAAERIIALSGKTPQECEGFNRRFQRIMGPFLPMMDADEGRRPPGAWTAFLRGFYNTVVVTPAVAVFRRSEQSRHGPER